MQYEHLEKGMWVWFILNFEWGQNRETVEYIIVLLRAATKMWGALEPVAVCEYMVFYVLTHSIPLFLLESVEGGFYNIF